MNYQLWKLDKNFLNFDIYIEKCDLFSFDIFDTLLFRNVEMPDDIFFEVGREAEKKNLLRKGVTPLQFKHIRRLAQNKVKQERLAEAKDYTIHDIYENIPRNIGKLDNIKQLELDIENSHTYLNLSVYSLIKHLKSNNKEIVLTSDMYLSKNEILTLLLNNGFDLHLIDNIFVSSDLNLTKSQGGLFDYIINNYNIINQKIVHIGDNYYSDYYNANIKGINAIHYDIQNFEYHNGISHEKIYKEELLPELLSLRKLAGNLVNNIKEEDKFPFIFGATILGPFFTVFIEWVLDLLEEENIQNLYPIMSEGLFFEKLINNAKNYRNYKVDVNLLYLSRVSTFLATIENFDKDFVENFIAKRMKFTVKSILEVLNLQKDDVKDITNILDIKVEDLSKNDLSKLKNILVSDEVTKIINNRIIDRKCKLEKYFKDNVEQSNLVTLDFGFRGTTANNIETIFKNTGLLYNCSHILAIMTKNIRNNVFNGISFRGFCYDSNENSKLTTSIFEHCQIIESIMNNNVQSTIDYKIVNNNVIPLFEENYDNEECIKLKTVIQEGILFFQTIFLEHYKNKRSLITNLFNKNNELLEIINRVFILPTYNEASVLGKFIFKNGFYEVEKHQFIPEEILNTSYTVEDILYNDEIKSKIYWVNGAITLKDTNYLLKKFLLDYNNFYNTNSNKYKSMKIAVTIINQGINNVCIYGAGEAGRTILYYLRLFNINVHYFIDSNHLLHGHYIDNIEVTSLSKALDSKVKHFIVGSFSFIEEIESAIKLLAEKKCIDVNIIKYSH